MMKFYHNAENPETVKYEHTLVLEKVHRIIEEEKKIVEE